MWFLSLLFLSLPHLKQQHQTAMAIIITTTKLNDGRSLGILVFVVCYIQQIVEQQQQQTYTYNYKSFFSPLSFIFLLTFFILFFVNLFSTLFQFHCIWRSFALLLLYECIFTNLGEWVSEWVSKRVKETRKFFFLFFCPYCWCCCIFLIQLGNWRN